MLKQVKIRKTIRWAGGFSYAGKAPVVSAALKTHITNDACKVLYPAAGCEQIALSCKLARFTHYRSFVPASYAKQKILILSGFFA